MNKSRRTFLAQIMALSGSTYSKAWGIGNFAFWKKKTTTSGLYDWGDNFPYELGNGTTVSVSPPPVFAQAGTGWLSIQSISPAATSFGPHLGLFSDGSLWGWGLNSSGQLGSDSVDSRSSPVQVGALSDWRKPGATTSASLAI